MNEKKKEIDRDARNMEDAYTIDSYKKRRFAEAEQRGNAKGQSRMGLTQVSGGAIRKTGNAASSGLNFLSGDMFGGSGGGVDISANLQDMIGFGGPAKHSKPAGIKPKRTTISTGGKRITITETGEGLAAAGKKKEKSVVDNINDLMNMDFDL